MEGRLLNIWDPTSRKQASRVTWLQMCVLLRGKRKNGSVGSSETSTAAKSSSKADGAAIATTGPEGTGPGDIASLVPECRATATEG